MNGVPVGSAPKVTLAGPPRTKLELLQELAESQLAVELKRQYNVGLSETDLTTTIAGEIAAGRYPRTQYSLVILLHDVLQIPVGWPQINPTCVQRLRVAALGALETESLIRLLLAVTGVTGLPAALPILADLSTSGSLSNLLSHHNANANTKATIVTAIMLANPSFARPTQVEQSANGDALFNAICDGEPDLNLAGAVAQIVTKARLVDQLFRVGADNLKIAKFTSAVFGRLAAESIAINLPPELVLEKRQYLLQYPQYNPTDAFIRQLATRNELLSLAETQKFELDRLPFYKAVLLSSDGTADAKFRAFLSGALRKLDQKQWEKSLISPGKPISQLLPLVDEIKQKDPKFTLPTPARDAALEQVRNVVKGNIAITEELRLAFSGLMSALSKDTVGSLGTDLMEDLCGLTDLTQITRLIDFVGGYLDVNNSYEVGRVVRRVFVPLISKPALNTAVWMAEFVRRKDALFRAMTEYSRNDLASRLRKALQTEALDPQISEAFGRVLEQFDSQSE